jgi:hypothetical protein
MIVIGKFNKICLPRQSASEQFLSEKAIANAWQALSEFYWDQMEFK